MPRVPLKGLGDIGWIADQEGYELAVNALTDVNNMRSRAGWMERTRGHRQISTDLTFAPYFLAGYSTNDARYLLQAGLRAIQLDDGATRTDLGYAAGLTMNAGHRWTGVDFFGFQILNNQADLPLSWNGSLADDCIALATWPATYRAKAIRTIKFHLVALNVTKAGVSYPHLLKISAAAEPGALPASWDETDTTVETDEIEVKGKGVVVDAILMGENLVIYKEFSVAVLRYAPSNQSAWACDPLPFNLGMMSQNCGADVPGIGHVVLTKGDFVRFDGNAVESVIDETHRDWLFANIDENYWPACFVTINHKYSEVWACFPERGASSYVCTKALTWNWRTGRIGKRDLPNVTCGCPAVLSYAVDTYDSDTVTFDSESVLTFNSGTESVTANDTRLFVGTSGSEVFLMDSSDAADGANFTAYIERTGLNDLGPGFEGLVDRRKKCSRLWLDIDAAVGTQLSVQIGASDEPNTAPTYETAVTFTVGTDRWIDAYTSGVYLAYKVSAAGAAFWRVRSGGMEVKPGGKY